MCDESANWFPPCIRAFLHFCPLRFVAACVLPVSSLRVKSNKCQPTSTTEAFPAGPADSLRSGAVEDEVLVYPINTGAAISFTRQLLTTLSNAARLSPRRMLFDAMSTTIIN